MSPITMLYYIINLLENQAMQLHPRMQIKIATILKKLIYVEKLHKTNFEIVQCKWSLSYLLICN